jgi:uncharacterized protein
MHKAVVAHFEIAARDPDVVRRFYAALFGWHLSGDGAGACNSYVISAHGNEIGGVVISAGDSQSGGLRLIVEVDDVLENLCYADELGGKIIELPHETGYADESFSVAYFTDPEGNVVGLSRSLRARSTSGSGFF